MQHALKHVERPGGSHKALDGKKQCRALAQAAELTFGLPIVFRSPEDWKAELKGEVFDLVQCSQRIYMGDAANTSQALQVVLDRPKKWAQWIFSMGNVWQEDSPHAGSTPHSALQWIGWWAAKP